MSRSVRAEGKLPKGSKPIPEVMSALRHILVLPDVRRVVHDRPVLVRSGKPWLTVSTVCKDGVRVRVRGGGLIQETFVKCDNPSRVKEILENTWAKKHTMNCIKGS